MKQAALVLVLALAGTGHAFGGEFSVNPIRLEMSAAARSSAISVRNDGKVPLNFQVQAMEWAQDAAGKDVYTETKDLVFFPKIMTVEPGQDGIVRVGTRTPVLAAERTYRLFIEELPGAKPPPDTKGAQISVLIRFGAPVFISPVNAQDALELEAIDLAAGQLKFSVRNKGNRHQVVQGVQVAGFDRAGAEVYAVTLADRYLLAGVMKSYSTAVPAEQCTRISRIEIDFRTDKLSAKHKLDVTQSMCAAK